MRYAVGHYGGACSGTSGKISTVSALVNRYCGDAMAVPTYRGRLFTRSSPLVVHSLGALHSVTGLAIWFISVVTSVFRYLDTGLRCEHSKHSCHEKYL